MKHKVFWGGAARIVGLRKVNAPPAQYVYLCNFPNSPVAGKRATFFRRSHYPGSRTLGLV